MPSERRLHPFSFLFAIAGQLKQFLLPGLVVILTAGAAGGEFEPWYIAVVIPVAIVALGRSLSYRYRLDETELVIRTGFVFRNERHIPFSRIQNIEAIQNVLHRLFAVIEVRVETGAGKEDDATMRVVPVAAYQEIRERVLASRPHAAAADAESAREAAPIFRLSGRELLLSGFIENRSAVLIAAAFGVVWELGLFDTALGYFLPDRASRRSFVRQTLRGLFDGGMPGLQTIAMGIAALLLLFAAVTIVSMAWAYLRLYGFTLRRVNDDLRAEFGLFTRVSTTIPLRRIQTLTIFEGPLQRLFDRAAVKVETAGADAGEQGATGREPLAPIIRRGELKPLLGHVMPEIGFDGVAWQPPAPGAFGRELRQSAIVASLVAAVVLPMLELWTLALLAALLAAGAFHARRYVATLGWATHDGAVFFRRGWLWRRTTMTRYSKMQIVAFHTSPFDRRTGMARVRVDTAGAARRSDRIDIPYLPVDAARELHRLLATEASGTSFQW
jgi:putative membrane protein